MSVELVYYSPKNDIIFTIEECAGDYPIHMRYPEFDPWIMDVHAIGEVAINDIYCKSIKLESDVICLGVL